VGQIPVFFGERNTGRPENPADKFTSKYLDVANTPLFSFGHGLSYGEFKFSNLKLSAETLRPGDTIDVTVDVANEGVREAEETVFLFTHRKVASVAPPLLELKGFAKITLAPGARGRVTLALSGSQLRFLGQDLAPVFESGAVEVLVGPSAERARLSSAVVELMA